MVKLKKFFVLTLVLVIIASLAACGKTAASNKKDGKSEIKVGLLTGVAGLGDKSFNDSSYDGAKKAEKELGIKLKVVEPGDLSAAEGLLRDLVKAGNDMVVAVGFDMVEPVKVVAEEFPDKKFAVIDAFVDLPNVQSLLFKEHEGSFLVGALSAMMTETNKIASVPAMDVPFLNRFSKAFEQGAKHVKPDINVTIQPMGSDMNTFNDPGKMKNIALSMYSQGIDVIYPVAGGSGTGLFEAAKEKGKYAIGINSDQDDMAKGLVLTSMVKRCDVAVFNAFKSFVDNKFEAGVQSYGLENGGISLTEFQYTKDIIGAEKIQKINEIKDEIISGKIKVVDITQ